MQHLKQIWLKITSSLIFLAYILHDFSHPVFARMGSTGGGHSSGGHSSGGGGFSGGSSHSGGNSSSNGNSIFGFLPFFKNHHFIPAFFIIDLLISLLISVCIYFYTIKHLNNNNEIDNLKTKKKCAIMVASLGFIVSFLIPSAFIIVLIAAFLTSMNTTNDFDIQDIINADNSIKTSREFLLKQNMPLNFFKAILKKWNFKFSKQPLANQKQLLDIYGQAQFLYSETIRNYLAKNYDTSALKQYLAEPFYSTMVNEIKLKAENQTLDDVVVDHSCILESFKVENLIIAKIQAIGIDSENQANSNFDASFKQEKWEDYVVYAYDTQNNTYKIVNIIYGEHFHLNGKDFNNQKGLTDKYEEHDLRKHEHDMLK